MKKLEAAMGYRFRNRAYLEEALTHSSYVNGKHNSNERLEFLGDSVLSVVVSKYLFESLDVPEGKLTKIRSQLVCEDTLYGFAKRINLGAYIKLGRGEENNGGRNRRSILADAFEALIAAVYLDGGLERARTFILRFVPSIEEIKAGHLAFGDYKTVLQEIIQQNPEERIEYEISGERGAAHMRVFTANVLLNGQTIGSGSGKSKKEAEQAAAKEAVSLMGYATD
ncbi:MAG: ribonuclease III [Bacteroides sp.]|nr:ribonuclease III [Eubacterium sp.]MCM1418576.1 ribonuclease III [Roseburia sp.]MCM1462631.1 ribonuclease III [Bacteroides sp.]